LTKLALEMVDGLVIHPSVGQNKSDDLPATLRFELYEALVDGYYPPDRTLLCAYPGATRWAGPREALFHALVRKNYGMTHFIVGRDHAGPGLPLWGPYESQEVFSRFSPDEIGITPLKFDATFYCQRCASFASARSCPHGREHSLEISGTRIRELLRNDGHIPHQVVRPDLAEILKSHYRPDARRAPAPQARATSTRTKAVGSGFILWFTGLSGSGKTTLANAVQARLLRPVEVLDGDELRALYTKDLSFSKEDRETAIQRVGFIARLLARNGVVAIAASISAYRAARADVRRHAIGDGVAFVEVFAKAELDVLVARDVKGLYKRAIAGEIENFTGISDPYEAPLTPDVLVRTDIETIEESVVKIIAALIDRDVLSPLDLRGAGKPQSPAALTISNPSGDA
jgi:sulfate adenylyltransferase